MDLCNLWTNTCPQTLFTRIHLRGDNGSWRWGVPAIDNAYIWLNVYLSKVYLSFSHKKFLSKKGYWHPSQGVVLYGLLFHWFIWRENLTRSVDCERPHLFRQYSLPYTYEMIAILQETRKLYAQNDH